MNKKGSMELGVNSIVILVIAIVMLGLILGIIVPKIKNAGLTLEAKEPDPSAASASEQLTMSRTEISAYAGDEVVIKVGVYNPTAATVLGVKVGSTTANCGALNVNAVSNGKDIPSGGQEQFTVILTMKKAMPAQTYLCSLNSSIVGSEIKDFTIKVVK